MSRVFAHGALRLYMLSLLEDHPRHGYELIQLLEDRFLGMYTPSAGTIYPRLASLEEDGLVEHDVVDGKRVVPPHRRRPRRARGRVATRSTGSPNGPRRPHASSPGRSVTKCVSRSATCAASCATRSATCAGRSAAPAAAARPTRRTRSRRAPATLRAELDAFVGDVLGSAGSRIVDADRLAAVRAALLDAAPGDRPGARRRPARA